MAIHRTEHRSGPSDTAVAASTVTADSALAATRSKHQLQWLMAVLLINLVSLGIELAEFGMTTETSTPEEARARMDGNLTMWRERMLKVGMTPNN